MFRDSLKKMIGINKNEEKEKVEGNDKRKIENLIFFVVLLVVTLILINTIWNGSKKNIKQENTTTTKQLALQNNIETSEKVNSSMELESKLENILSKIEGVGKVNVCINYSESSEVVAMYNENSKISTTEETDTSGGVRKIQENNIQKDIVYKEENGEKIPITQKIVEPKIEGIIITAKGAKNSSTKADIMQAVEAITGVATHKIQVFEMN